MSSLKTNIIIEERVSQCALCCGAVKLLFNTRDYRRTEVLDSHSVVWCDDCGYGRIDREFQPAETAKFYDVKYYTHGEKSELKRPEKFVERVMTHAAWRVDAGSDFSISEVGKPGKLLDIGCGEGKNMEKLKRAGFDVVGIEPDPKARRVAQQYGDVYAGTAEEPPVELSDGYDYVLLSHVLEHTISPKAALANVSGLLVSGGKLIVEVPNSNAAGFSEFGPVWPWTDVPRHIHFFSRASLTKFLENAGFSVSRVFFTGYTRQFKSEWIADLTAIHSALDASAIGDTSGTSVRAARRSLKLLLRTAFARPERKYDSIRMHAIKQ